VEFQYQIQTTLSQRASTLQDQGTLRAIEKKISDVLVDNLFGSSCGSYSDESSERRSLLSDIIVGNFGDADSLVGLSADPSDEIIPGIAGRKC
jgi:hypothetical protein